MALRYLAMRRLLSFTQFCALKNIPVTDICQKHLPAAENVDDNSRQELPMGIDIDAYHCLKLITKGVFKLKQILQQIQLSVEQPEQEQEHPLPAGGTSVSYILTHKWNGDYVLSQPSDLDEVISAW